MVAKVEVTHRGPIFLPGAAQAPKEAVEDAIRDLVADGERAVKLQLYPGHGVKTGLYARSVHGDITGSLNGVIHDSNVVYGAWLEGVSSRNDRTRFKGYSMFRNAYQQLERIARATLQRRVTELVRRLGG